MAAMLEEKYTKIVMDYMNIKIQWYNNGIYNNVPNGVMTLKQFVTNIKEPSERLKDVFDRLQKATLSGDLKTKDKIKQEELFFDNPHNQCFRNKKLQRY